MGKHLLKDKTYTLEEIHQLCVDDTHISLSPGLQQNIISSKVFLDKKVSSGDVIYGVNTGFGKLSDIRIPSNKINQLQRNLILSHAVGVGPPVPNLIVKIMLLLKIISLAKGNSGIKLETINFLIELFNSNCLPVVPMKGSVGASGDLAPLAHIGLTLIGEGKVSFKNKILSSKSALKKMELKPLKLEYKEGLALINGTQFSTAYGVYCANNVNYLLKLADICAALTIEGLECSKDPFLDFVNNLKPYKGQNTVSKNLLLLFKNSEIMKSHKKCNRVQDMYSVRCVPQVHGSCRDLFDFSRKQINIEINSVSDNPVIVKDKNKIISAGHFHAESIAHALDILSISLASLGNISERRIFYLYKGDFNLSPFLIENPGINSGFMMLQVTAASLVSENKLLANPSSVDSIPTCADQEDYVSMAPYSGRKLYEIVSNLKSIFSIEILSACQAIDMKKGLNPGKELIPIHKFIRKKIKFLDKDRLLKNDLEEMLNIIEDENFYKQVNGKNIL